MKNKNNDTKAHAVKSKILSRKLTIDTDGIVKKIGKNLFGVDSQARSVLNKMNVYMNLPGLIREPLILNFWGPTGSGKTRLVRELVKYTSLGEHFHYINLANPSSKSWSEKMKSITLSVYEDYDKSELFMDLDHLLDNGDKDPNYEYDEDIMKGISLYNEEEEYVNFKRKLKRKRNTSKHKKVLEGIRPVVLFFDEFQHLKSIDERGYEIRGSHANDVWAIIDQGLEYLTGFYVPTIIFTAGNINLSELESVSNWEGAPDEDTSDTIPSIHTIHHTLSKRFRPEMIARLRNDHYFFTPIDKNNALKIINRELNLYKKILKSEGGLDKIIFDPQFDQFLFKMATTKGLGARGIESIVLHALKSHTGSWITEVINNGFKIDDISQIHLVGDDHSITYTVTMHDQSIVTYVSIVQVPLKRPLNIDANEISINSVHEAGHAITAFILCNRYPDHISITPNRYHSGRSDGIRAYVKYQDKKEVQSRRNLLFEMSIRLGGILAEKLIFGKEHITAGASSDLDSVTTLAKNYLLDYGLGNKLLKRVIGATGFFEESHPSMDVDDRVEFDQLIDLAKDISWIILNTQRTALEGLAKVSFYKGIVDTMMFTSLMDTLIDKNKLIPVLSLVNHPELDSNTEIKSQLEDINATFTTNSYFDERESMEIDHNRSVTSLITDFSFDYTKKLFGERADFAREHVLYGMKPAEEQQADVLNSLLDGTSTVKRETLLFN